MTLRRLALSSGVAYTYNADNVAHGFRFPICTHGHTQFLLIHAPR